MRVMSAERQTETTRTDRKAAISADPPSLREISEIAGVIGGGCSRSRTSLYEIFPANRENSSEVRAFRRWSDDIRG
jgi:hypothetical protein